MNTVYGDIPTYTIRIEKNMQEERDSTVFGGCEWGGSFDHGLSHTFVASELTSEQERVLDCIRNLIEVYYPGHEPPELKATESCRFSASIGQLKAPLARLWIEIIVDWELLMYVYCNANSIFLEPYKQDSEVSYRYGGKTYSWKIGTFFDFTVLKFRPEYDA